MPDDTEYLCTHSAHNPESLTDHMNNLASDGWELLTVDFAIRGETGFHALSGGAASAPTREPAGPSGREVQNFDHRGDRVCKQSGKPMNGMMSSACTGSQE